MRELSNDELEVIDSLVMAWNEFIKLPIIHPDERVEFKSIIHEAQRIVLSRPALEKVYYKQDDRVLP